MNKDWQRYSIEMSNGAMLDVSAPADVDIDGEFKAYCHDEQEMIRISGWHISWMEEETA